MALGPGGHAKIEETRARVTGGGGVGRLGLISLVCAVGFGCSEETICHSDCRGEVDLPDTRSEPATLATVLEWQKSVSPLDTPRWGDVWIHAELIHPSGERFALPPVEYGAVDPRFGELPSGGSYRLDVVLRENSSADSARCGAGTTATFDLISSESRTASVSLDLEPRLLVDERHLTWSRGTKPETASLAFADEAASGAVAFRFPCRFLRLEQLEFVDDDGERIVLERDRLGKWPGVPVVFEETDPVWALGKLSSGRASDPVLLPFHDLNLRPVQSKVGGEAPDGEGEQVDFGAEWSRPGRYQIGVPAHRNQTVYDRGRDEIVWVSGTEAMGTWAWSEPEPLTWGSAEPWGNWTEDGDLLSGVNSGLWLPVSEGARFPDRTGHAVAYDVSRSVIVLFGGAGMADTWEFDGREWKEKEHDGGPSSRTEHQLIYDEVKKRIVLFGGTSVDGEVLTDLWSWDGSRWTELSAGTGASGSVAFDPSQGVLVLVTAGEHGTRTWHLNEGHWELMDVDSPLQPDGTLFASDTGVHYYGGAEYCGVEGASSQSASSLWSWEGGRWTLTSSVGPGRHEAVVIHDDQRDRIWVHGGAAVKPWWHCGNFGQPCRLLCLQVASTSTHEFDGTHWTPIGSAGAGAMLQGRSRASMAYDEARRRTVLFGGVVYRDGMGENPPPPEPLDDTWEWDGASWWPSNPRHRPPAGGGPMAYEPTQERTILVADGEFGTETWSWDGEDWTRVPLDGASPSCGLGEMVADVARERLVLVQSCRDGESETWEFARNRWTLREDVSTPRWSWPDGVLHGFGPHQLTYDEGRKRVVLVSDGTWELDGAAWKLASADRPPWDSGELDRSIDERKRRMVYDPRLERTVFFGPSGSWAWDGRKWVIVSRSGVAGDWGRALVFDRARGGFVRFGRDGVTWTQLSASAMIQEAVSIDFYLNLQLPRWRTIVARSLEVKAYCSGAPAGVELRLEVPGEGWRTLDTNEAHLDDDIATTLLEYSTQDVALLTALISEERIHFECRNPTGAELPPIVELDHAAIDFAYALED